MFSLVWSDPYWTEVLLALAPSRYCWGSQRTGSAVIQSSHRKKGKQDSRPTRAAQNQFLFGPGSDICFSQCCCGWWWQRKLLTELKIELGQFTYERKWNWSTRINSHSQQQERPKDYFHYIGTNKVKTTQLNAKFLLRTVFSGCFDVMNAESISSSPCSLLG